MPIFNDAAPRATPLVFLLALVAALVSPAHAATLDERMEAVRNLTRGIPAQWEGSVRGAFNADIGGEATLRFLPLADGRRKMVLVFRGGDVSIQTAGVIACPGGSRSYRLHPDVWRDDASGLHAVGMNDTLGRAPGGDTPGQDHSYHPRTDSLSVSYLDDRLNITLNARMWTLVKAGRTRDVLLRLDTSIERTLGNEYLFDGADCAEDATFELDTVEPSDQHENVRHVSPVIRFEFTAPIDPASIRREGVFELYTQLRAPAGAGPAAREVVKGRLEIEDEKKLRFFPDKPLRPGVRYEMKLASGREGPRGEDGEVLEEDSITGFSTAVSPDEVKVHVYQTSQDAPLLLRKPTAARVFVKWEEDEDVDPDWQVLKYKARVETKDPDTGRELFPESEVTVTRPDQFDREDRRLGKDSVDVFGWRPANKQADTVEIYVKPDDPHPEDAEWEEAKGRRSLDYAREQVDRLAVDGYLVLAREWRARAPGLADIVMVQRAMSMENEFGRQVLPVLEVAGRVRGFFAPPYSTIGDSIDWDDHLALLHDHAALVSGADVTVGYYPPSFQGGQGEGIAGVGGGHPRRLHNVVGMSTATSDSDPRPSVSYVPLVTHEFGHVFGLDHVPYVRDEAHRKQVCDSSYFVPAVGIEGFRINRSGDRGWAKSSVTGNSQVEKTLQNFMFPCIYDPPDWFWIADDAYESLVERLPSIVRSQRVRRGTGGPVSRQVAFDAGADSGGPGWVLASGFVAGGEAELLPLVALDRDADTLSPGGTYSLALEDAGGRVLAEKAIGPRNGEDGHWYFSAVLPASADMARVVLRHRNQELARLEDRGAPAAPRISSHAPDALLAEGDLLRWENAGDGIRYSVRYSPTGEAPWQTFAALVPETSMALPVPLMEAGDSPTLLLVAHGATRQTQSRLRIRLPEPPPPPASTGEGELVLQVDQELRLPLSASHCVTALAPGKLIEARLRLPGGGGEGRLQLLHAGGELLLQIIADQAGSPFAATTRGRLDASGGLLGGGGLAEADVADGQWRLSGKLPLGTREAAFTLRLDCR